MRNNTCIVCSKEFEPRRGKLYCSNACKQKGYSDNKIKVAEIGNTQKEQEEKKPEKQYVIYFQEYQEYRKKYPNSLSEFPLYYFFRKNWIGTFDMELFNAYIKTYDNYWWNEFWGMNEWGEETGKFTLAREKYDEFLEEFFGGDEFKISFEGREQP